MNEQRPQIADMQPVGGDMRLRIRTGKLDLSDVKLGDSICTSGGDFADEGCIRCNVTVVITHLGCYTYDTD